MDEFLFFIEVILTAFCLGGSYLLRFVVFVSSLADIAEAESKQDLIKKLGMVALMFVLFIIAPVTMLYIIVVWFWRLPNRQRT